MLTNELIKHYIIFQFQFKNLNYLLSNNYKLLLNLTKLSEKKIILLILSELQYFTFNINFNIKNILKINTKKTKLIKITNVKIVSNKLNNNLCYLIWAYYFGFIVIEKI